MIRADTNKIDIKNVDYSESIDRTNHYVQYIYFDCQCSYFSTWFAEIVKKESAAAAEMTKCLHWCCTDKMNKIDITDKINYKHCSDKVDKKIKISEIDHTDETDNYCWNCYLNNAVMTELAVQTVW